MSALSKCKILLFLMLLLKFKQLHYITSQNYCFINTLIRFKY